MNNTNEATLKDLEETVNANRHLTFEEYAALRAPAIDAVINDYAVKIIEKAKEEDREITLEEAREIAKNEIPVAFVPEWMRNLRVSANVAGTELTYLEQIKQGLNGITEMLSIILDASGMFDAYVKKHAGEFKRMEGEGVNDGDE